MHLSVRIQDQLGSFFGYYKEMELTTTLANGPFHIESIQKVKSNDLMLSAFGEQNEYEVKVLLHGKMNSTKAFRELKRLLEKQGIYRVVSYKDDLGTWHNANAFGNPFSSWDPNSDSDSDSELSPFKSKAHKRPDPVNSISPFGHAVNHPSGFGNSHFGTFSNHNNYDPFKAFNHSQIGSQDPFNQHFLEANKKHPRF